MKRSYLFLLIGLTMLLLVVGCSKKSTTNLSPTISKNPDSEYAKTFKDLSLGILFDYDFYLPNADKRWVRLWVEKYSNGIKDSEPLTQMYYGNDPMKVSEGHLGFGLINPNTENPYVFLYSPNVKSQPKLIKKAGPPTYTMSSWDYALGKEKIKLHIGETKILAAYIETKSNSVSVLDVHDEESANRVIDQNDYVLLLKIKIEDKDFLGK